MSRSIALGVQPRAFSSSLLHSQVPFFRVRLLILGTLLLLIVLVLYVSPIGPGHHAPSLRNTNPILFSPIQPSSPEAAGPAPRIAKATMLYGRKNAILERVVNSHFTHNRLHGYEMHVLRSRLTKGYTNKLLWMQQLIMEELQKPKTKRVEWIMYLDASTILLNPQIPLTVFLPPPSQGLEAVHFILTKALNETDCASTLFLRTSPTALAILEQAAASQRVDLGELRADVSIAALQSVLTQQEYYAAAVYHPSTWYSTHFSFNRITSGGFLACASSGSPGMRWKTMSDLVALGPTKFSRPLEQTIFAKRTETYWTGVAEAIRVLRQAGERGHDETRGDFRAEVRALRVQLEQHAYDETALARTIKALKEGLHSD